MALYHWFGFVAYFVPSPTHKDLPKKGGNDGPKGNGSPFLVSADHATTVLPDRPGVNPVNISEHFTLDEAVATTHKNLVEANRAAFTIDHAFRAAHLAHLVLEPLRKQTGPIRVSSWFRCPALNSLVGGEPTSEHLTGGAVDLIVPDLWAAYRALQKNPNAGQTIIYLKAGKPAWVHVGIAPRKSQLERLLVCHLGPRKKYESFTEGKDYA